MIFSFGRTDKMSDSKLLEAYIDSGRLDYFGELYNRYMPLIYGLCLKYLKNTEAAEDAVMHIFEELVPKLERSQVREFRTWVYTVAKNHCLQKLRKKSIEVPTDFGVSFVESADIVHLLSKQDAEKRFVALEDCIEKLPEPQRESIKLFFMDEKSYADIVEITSYQLKSVKSYIQNGKRNLRICLETKGFKE